MSKSILVVLCAATAAALLFVVLWPERTRGAAALLPAPEALESTVAAAPADLPEPQVRREEPPPSAPEPMPVQPPTITESPAEPVEPAEGNADSVLKMLADPALVDACARLSETDAQTLIDLAARAQKVLDAYKMEECRRRVEAGLYERLEGYKPGEPFSTPGHKREEIIMHSISESEARRIEFTPQEYPHMHTLKAQIYALKSEYSSRERAAR